ncbi:hypothetical protein L210DRAFT_3563354 [Boletus edulis BED1]|uniref:F-box domain-containing protein n=1 Tax=Boletus edulis BED1 TaxID=1328754 RepID=A0AAD4BGW7_BOLED|nr:hypothetical protein L210DRAFT_3563354 [Boletus edulis BED1]
MKDLPIELVGAVVESVTSTSDLLSLRSVNATCHRLVTPHAFRKINIHNSIQSAQDCQSILASPSLATHVREVIYDPRDHAQFCLLPVGAHDACDELEIADLEVVLTETFCALSGFTNLESVTLNFWPSFRSQDGTEVQEHPFWFTNRQIAVLHAMHYAIKSSSVRSLTLNNVVLISSACYDFVSSVTDSPLHHFSMSVVANSELGAWSGSKALNGPLSSLLPLSNANLKSLNIVFDHTPSADGIEEFIVRHKASLRRLELHACSSYVPSISTPIRRWSTIWKRFEEELESLRKIVMGNVHQGYALLDGASGYIPHLPLPALAGEDEKDYLQFSNHVNLRSALARTCL